MFDSLWLEILEVLLPLARDVIVSLILIAVALAWKWWKGLAIDDWIKDLVEDAVLFAQEKYWDKTGLQKFHMAKMFVLDKLKEKGIPINEEWIDALIDATVKRLRDEFEDWYGDEFVLEDF